MISEAHYGVIGAMEGEEVSMATEDAVIETQVQETCHDKQMVPVYSVIVGNVEEPTVFDNSGAVEASICVAVESKPNSNSAVLTAATLDEPFFHWDKNSIKMLIELYRENIELFDSPNVKKKKAWKIIAAGLIERGLGVTYQQCESKWKNLQRNYRKVKYDMNTMGTTSSRWPYFKEIDEINRLRTTDKTETVSNNTFLDVTDMSDGGLATSSTQYLNTVKSATNTSTNRKRKLLEEEPAWFRSYRVEVQRRHEQRLALQRQIMEQHKLLTRQLIKVLECFKK
ncbi:hypothetical protein CHUAL_006573 [Chamberlinius hualienensis]